VIRSNHRGVNIPVHVDLRTPEVSAKLEDLRDHYRKLAISEYQDVDAHGKRLIGQSRMEEAKALYLDAKAWNIPDIAEQTKEPLAAIERHGVTCLFTAPIAYRAIAGDLAGRGALLTLTFSDPGQGTATLLSQQPTPSAETISSPPIFQGRRLPEDGLLVYCNFHFAPFLVKDRL
jgi:hypothetical protein